MNKYKNIINNASEHCIINQQEVFIIEYDNELIYCNLKTLNYLVNELRKKVNIIFNIYQDSNKKKYNMFCKPVISYQK